MPDGRSVVHNLVLALAMVLPIISRRDIYHVALFRCFRHLATETTLTISSGSGLSDVTFLVLASLADGPKHGLRVTEDIESRTGGEVRIGPGALYGALKRLREGGLIEELTEAPDPHDDDSRRRYYRITQEGREAARKEAGHLRSLVKLAESKRLLLDER